MTGSRAKVLELLAAGKVTPTEADGLLRALKRRRVKPGEWILNPLARLSPKLALALTAIPVGGQILLERVGVRFNGAIDMHVVATANSWRGAFLDAALGFPLLSVVLFLAAWAAGKRARPLDLLAAVGLSRWPVTLGGLLLGWPVAGPNLSIGGLLALVPGMLLFLGWSITMLCLGYREATGLSGARLSVSFIVGLVMAELLSVPVHFLS